jgi:hypothetical protein
MPAPESLYDDVYVLGGLVRGWYSVDERSAGVHKGEDERELAHPSPPTSGSNSDGNSSETGAVAQQMTAAVEAGEDT